ncbi:hypothetical protein MKW98_029222 [Papaver atlanticum]|uniref:Metaxin n=1 Tax=Papaver atlanticum TaxID=357466 RepID=A0AAD4T3S9_9MAGN|nr:hypothetical protein MKW98_029222 [Papaver atlanticum]
MAEDKESLVLVARKPSFGLPTGCPSCLPAYFYLRFADVNFQLQPNLTYPDSDQIPYVECGDYVAFNNEKGGVIESLKEDGVVDLDSGLPSHTVPEWLAMKAMIGTWLADAVSFELWAGSDRNSADTIYYSDLPWPIGKVLHFMQTSKAKQLLEITKANAERRETEIYRKATLAYQALSTLLGEQTFFFENRPTSLDAVFLGHALFTLQALPETSLLRSKLLEHRNLVRYCEDLKGKYLEAGPSSTSTIPKSPFETSSSSTPKRGTRSNWSAKPKGKPRREKTEEEKTFKRRAKYFLATQFIAVLVFLSLLGPGGSETEMDGDDMEYDD